MKPKRLYTTFKIFIKANAIIEFNKNLNGNWGQFETPFLADQFIEIDTRAEIVDGIPHFKKDHDYMLSIESDLNPEQVKAEYIRLDILGLEDLRGNSPRSQWTKVLNLDTTDGAIGMNGDFFLGQSEKGYKLCTHKKPEIPGYNIVYSVLFSINVNGIFYYCRLDPLIKTSADDEPATE